jgi:hypothetical protein
MKNIKDITILIFAIIGFYAMVTGFTKKEQITTPESHIWEFHMTSESNSTRAFSINKLTGEVRQHSTGSYTMGAKNQYKTFATHRVSSAK